MTDVAPREPVRRARRVEDRLRNVQDTLPGERDALPPDTLPKRPADPQGDENREPAKHPTPPP